MRIAKCAIAAVALLGIACVAYAAYPDKHCNYIPVHKAHEWTENGVTYHCGG